MATYITAIKFTAQGITNVRDTCKRAEAFRAQALKLGGSVKEVYWTLGAFDGVLIFDVPDDNTATALMLHLGAQGFVQTQTARAFTASEMQKILAAAGR
jgi:uncharacterized protein with GYD domain